MIMVLTVMCANLLEESNEKIYIITTQEKTCPID